MTRVASHPESGHVHALYVGGVNRADPIVIEPPFVVSVDPWQRLLVVEQPDEVPSSETTTVVKAIPAIATRAAPIAWHRAVPVGVAAAQHAGAVARSAGSTARSAAPPAGRFGIWLGKRVAFAAAFLVWLYGTVVFLLTRLIARVLLVSAIVLSAALGWVGPRLWSRAKKVVGQARDGARQSFSSR